MDFQYHLNFSGNTADSVTLIPSINEVRENNLERVICVADKGMNNKNISFSK